MTGSQEAGLMQRVTESMAGRAAVLGLMPMSARETDKVGVLRGGFPEVLARPRSKDLWFASYLQTYLERDVRAITAIRELSTFRRFFDLVASRHGQVLNKSDLAAPLGVSVPTIARWLDVLEATGQILLVPPFFENMGKRLIKSPKIFLADSGLACHLLGIRTEADMRRSPFRGALFEGFVAAEIVKAQLHTGRRKQLYYFRDQQGLEVDFLVPTGAAALALVEAKATRTPHPEDARSLLRLRAAMRGHETRALVVHEGPPIEPAGRTLAPDASALSLDQYLEVVAPTDRRPGRGR
jgi:predicted AAA+ superfamily ATPase